MTFPILAFIITFILSSAVPLHGAQPRSIIADRVDGSSHVVAIPQSRAHSQAQSQAQSQSSLEFAQPSLSTTGDHRTLVVLVNFANLTTQPFTAAQVQAVFQASADFFVGASYDKASVFGDIVGWWTLPISNLCSDFRIFNIQDATDSILRHSGFNPDDYQHIAYVFPSGGCDSGILGWAEVGGKHSWYNGSLSVNLASHELGHNFGLDHSHSLSISAQGTTTSEYGDSWDTMGAITGSAGHFNALQKERLGWLAHDDLDALLGEVRVGQLFNLAPYETITRGELKAVKIRKGGTDAAPSFYYVESRMGIGADRDLPVAVLIHTGTPTENNSTFLYDLDVVESATDYVLNVGQSYRDDNAGISIMVMSVQATHAVVSVTFTNGAASNKPQPRKRARFN